MEKNITIMHRLQQKNVTLEIEPLLIQLCKINKKANIRLQYEPIKRQSKLEAFAKIGNIIFLNESLFNKASLFKQKDFPQGKILNLTDKKNKGKSCRLFQFNEIWKESKISPIIDFCFRSASESKNPYVQILIDQASTIQKIDSSPLLKKCLKRYPSVKVEYLLTEKIDRLKNHNFTTLIYFGDFKNKAISETLEKKWFSIAEQGVHFFGSTLLYIASETKKGLLNLEKYFSNLENLTIIFDFLKEKDTSNALHQAMQAIRLKNQDILDNPLDVHRCGELISYALEDGNNLYIKNKGHQVKYGTII